MDAETLRGIVTRLNEIAGPPSAGKDDPSTRIKEIVSILKRVKSEVQPTEELLRASKAGVAIGKLRKHDDKSVSTLAGEIVKVWKDKIDENKKKRKREEEGEGSGTPKEENKDTKRVKAEGSSASPAPSSDRVTKPVKTEEKKPNVDKNGSDLPDHLNPDIKEEAAPTRPPLSTIDSTTSIPRTSKSDKVAGTLRADPDDGDDQRHKCVVMLYDALASDSTAETSVLSTRAIAIERAVWEFFKSSTGNDYRQKMRTLYLSVKDKNNSNLRDQIVTEAIKPDQVANLKKEDLASEVVKKMNERLATENLFKAKAVGETQAETDAFKCGRCQQRKCTYYQMQTRSADEPMTTFVTCTNCNNRWKFS